MSLGIVPDKENGMSPLGSLSTFPPGSRVRVESLCDCPRARGRLCAMGITPGTEIEMLSNSKGPLMILVRSSRLCLCRSLGQSVVVE